VSAPRTVNANGLTFAIDEQGAGEDVALFLHGFPEARQAWRAQLPVAASLGWRAVAPDLRGYGETSRPTAQSAYRIPHLVDDVVALFDALGARRRLLVGHDWGGVIGWQVALDGRAKLDGLVILNAPHPSVFSRVLNGGLRQRLRSWYAGFFLLPWLPEMVLHTQVFEALRAQHAGFPEDLLDLYRRNAAAPGAAKAMIDYYRANGLAMAGYPRTARQITCPTLLLWGEADVALDSALTEGNETHVQDFTLERLPGVSHWVMHEASDRVNAVIPAWMRAKGLAA
jgi:epoxide hydrolase 4